MIEVVHRSRVAEQPWRNGGGLTRELLAWPTSATAADARLRVRVAEVHRDGPFSRYPGVRRWFAVIEGAGVELVFADRTALCGIDTEPLAFDGDDAPMARVLDGPTVDLNLMASDDLDAVMRRATIGEDWIAAQPWRAVYCVDPCRLEIDGAEVVRLDAATLAWDGDAARQRWTLRVDDAPSPRAWWMAVGGRHR